MNTTVNHWNLIKIKASSVSSLSTKNPEQNMNEKRETISDFINCKKEIKKLNQTLHLTRAKLESINKLMEDREKDIASYEENLKKDVEEFQHGIESCEERVKRECNEAENLELKVEQLQEEVSDLEETLNSKSMNIDGMSTNLAQCKRYKKYLEDLTPPTFYAEQATLKLSRQKERRARKIKSKQDEWRLVRAEEVEDAKKKLNELIASTGKSRKEYKERRNAREELKRMTEEQAPTFEDTPLESSDEEVPMYFTKPQQLISVLSAVEQNIFDLMQEEAAAKQNLNIVKGTCQNEIEKMTIENDALKASIEAFERQEKIEEAAKGNEQILAKDISAKVYRGLERKLTNLEQKMRSVFYDTCGFQDKSSTPSTMFVLSELEGQVESIIAALSDMPDDYLETEEKKKEAKRREDRRQQKQMEMKQARDARKEKILERSTQPPKKNFGRPLMLRSKPDRKHISEDNDEVTQDELDELKHLS